jgi:hypothetical protein
MTQLLYNVFKIEEPEEERAESLGKYPFPVVDFGGLRYRISQNFTIFISQG